jgi:UDPglucose--hexose-1-phosphate uridylyltransferase
MTIHKRDLIKPDGRKLALYGRAPIDPAITATSPSSDPSASGSHVRWHPLRGEWVVYASHRQHRTFLPPPAWNPLAPATDPAHPTEVPAGAWEVAVFDNLFPALGNSGQPAPREIVDARPCHGTCEVVVFTQDPAQSLGSLPLDRIELVLAVWADRTRVLRERADVAYVFPFENRGVEVGVTLQHPHGQIYAYPFVPPIAERAIALQRDTPGLLATLFADEIAADVRTLYVSEHSIAVVPVCARWAYEIWVAPRRAIATLDQLGDDERLDLARALQLALRKLDALWQRPMPYVLAVHQAPVRGDHPHVHLHIEIYPWARMPGRLKYLAGSEVGAGVFTADSLPEAKAAELRAVEIDHA